MDTSLSNTSFGHPGLPSRLFSSAAGAVIAALAAAVFSTLLLLPLFTAGSGCGPIERWLENLPGVERVGPACRP